MGDGPPSRPPSLGPTSLSGANGQKLPPLSPWDSRRFRPPRPVPTLLRLRVRGADTAAWPPVRMTIRPTVDQTLVSLAPGGGKGTRPDRVSKGWSDGQKSHPGRALLGLWSTSPA